MAQKNPKTKQKQAKHHHTEVSCKVAKGLIQHVENHGDPVQTKKFLEQLENQRDFLDHHYHWISYQKLTELLHKAKKVTENKHTPKKIGEALMSKENLDSLHHILRSKQDIKRAYKHLPEFISHIHQTGELEIASVSNNAAELHFSYHLRHAPDQNVCQLNAGIFSSIPRIFRGENAEIEETHCQALGHPKCVYRISWEDHKKHEARWFHLGTVAGAIFGVILLALHKNLWATMSPLILSMTFIIPALFGVTVGKLVEQYQVIKSLKAQVASSRRHLSKLHHKTVKKHAEVERITRNISREDQKKIEELMLLNEQLVSEKEMMQQLKAREEQICQNIQQSVLISPCDLQKKSKLFDSSVSYHTADHVGGDFYDFHEDSKGSYILIGDVSGHGLGSVQVVHSAISYFRAIGKKHQADTVVQTLNNYLKKDLNQSITYVTAIYCHVEDNVLKYVNAGHRSGFVYKVQTGEFIELESAKQVLGAHFSNNKHLSLSEIPLDKNDLIILTTDGIIEAKNKELTEFGHERIHNAIQTLYRPNPKGEYPHPEDLTKTLIKEVEGHAHNVKDDDITILILKNK